MDVLLLLGASVRAAAFSARRASIPTTAIDLFADRDLAAVCPARAIPRDLYPRGLAAMAAEAGPGHWLYTGALENHPDLVDRIAETRPLWGNGGTVLRAVRDPFAVASLLERAGLPCPEVRSSPAGLPRDGSWLVKPLASAGGMGIRPLVPGEDNMGRPCYYQRRMAGPSLSAVFVAGRHGTALAGVTRQLIGRPGAEFAYLGSVGPWPITPAEEGRTRTLGETLADGFGLRGLFGVDFILREGRPWPVEVNPRYTASVEVLELALGRSLLGDHRSAFDPAAPPSLDAPPATGHGVVGKRILFAPSECRFAVDEEWRPPSSDPFELPRHADVPAPLTGFGPGEPVLTMFETASEPEVCLSRLEERASRWGHRLRSWDRNHK